ncbi:MAG: hypothetical protein QOD72_3494, partial [Acidimicrobiaceae bacterium]|nr:hypothetical protein [Acidimicrobiaceae bacterium]
MPRSTHTLQGVAVAAALAGAMVAASAPASAQGHDTRTTVVRPGQSVQQAIDTATPGTTIVLKQGTYEGNLTIAKTVTLRGDGPVVIEPAATVTHNACTDDPTLPRPEVTGICIGQIGP